VSPNVWIRPELIDIVFATQLGAAENWVKSCSGEIASMALNTKGELWGWGQSESNGESFGLDPDSGVSHTQGYTGVGTPGYMFLFYHPVRCTPNNLWKDFAFDYYHGLGIGLDDKLYTWGMNENYALGAGLPEGNGYKDPVLNPTLTADIKFVDAELLCSMAVTVTNRVYVWGDGWWYDEANWDFSSEIPMEITGLPVGSIITQACVCPDGVLVLLSTGEVWAAGSSYNYMDDQTSYPDGSMTFHRVDSLAAMFPIVKIQFTALGGDGIMCIDSDGNIWGYGDSSLQGGTATYSWNIPSLYGANYAGQRNFIDVVYNPHNEVMMAIDSEGWLWTWGYQYWGPHLAIGAEWPDYDPFIDELVYYRRFAGLAEPAINYQGEPAYLNNRNEGVSEYIQPLPQMLRHRPCGHWHIRLFEQAPEYAKNCWMSSIAIEGGSLLFVAAGKHLQIIEDSGCEIYMMIHDLYANTWEVVMYDDLKMAANAPGGAAISSNVYGFLNYKLDAEGNRLNEIYSNPAMGVWVVSGPTHTLNYVEFTDSIEMSGQNKLGVHSSGLVALAYTNTAGQLIVKVSTDFGATYNTVKTVGALAARKDYSLVVDATGNIYLAHQVSTSAVMVEKSVNQGTTWTTQIASNTLITGLVKVKLEVRPSVMFLFGASLVATAIEYSLNDGVTWETMTGEPGVSIVASGQSLTDPFLVSFRPIALAYNSIMYNYTREDTYGTSAWFERSVGQIDEDGNLVNSLISTSDASLVSNSTIFVYASWALHTIPDYYVAIAISMDGGVTWTIRSTPLQFFGSVTELTDIREDPLFYITDVPHLNHVWNFERSTWAEDFIPQQDKYKIV
jgi:hypothetical protein